jgi:hypothetical protein
VKRDASVETSETEGEEWTKNQFEEIDGGFLPYECDWYGPSVREEKLADMFVKQFAEIIK